MKKKIIRRKVGQVLRVPLSDGSSAFGLLLSKSLYAFFDLKAPGDTTPPIEQIVSRPVLFRILVMKYAITSGLWPVVGYTVPSAELLAPPKFCKKDAISGALSITMTGDDDTPATLEECLPLERAAVWDPEHVVSRLDDHFAGRPNKWVEMFRLK